MVLIEAALRLKRCVRESDTVARFGGDEYIVILSELDGGEKEAAEQVRVVAQKINAALSASYLLQVQTEGGLRTSVEHRCTVSIGVALFGKNDFGQENVLNRADAAMYRAKEAGRNLICFYEAN